MEREENRVRERTHRRCVPPVYACPTRRVGRDVVPMTRTIPRSVSTTRSAVFVRVLFGVHARNDGTARDRAANKQRRVRCPVISGRICRSNEPDGRRSFYVYAIRNGDAAIGVPPKCVSRRGKRSNPSTFRLAGFRKLSTQTPGDTLSR